MATVQELQDTLRLLVLAKDQEARLEQQISELQTRREDFVNGRPARQAEIARLKNELNRIIRELD
jgi:hypothetical protein